MPTILKIGLDASDFEKERNRVVDEVKELQAKTAQTNSVSVKVDPSDMSDLSDVSDKVEELEGTHEVKVNVKTSGAEKLPKSIGGAKKEAGGLVDQLKKSSDGADMLGDMFLGAGWKVEILKKGVESVGKIIAWIYELTQKSKREAVELTRANVQQAAEISAAAEAQSQKTDDIITQMRELNAQEKLSNVQKAKMLSLVEQMGGMYKNLGIEVDAATGKIKNLDDVAFQAAKRGIQEQIRAKDAELRQWQHNADAAAYMRDTAGVKVPFLKDWRIGGEADIKEAGKTISEAQGNMARLRSEIHMLRRQYDQLERERKASADDRVDQALDSVISAEQQVQDTQTQLFYDSKFSAFNDTSLGHGERRDAGIWIVGQSENNLKKLNEELKELEEQGPPDVDMGGLDSPNPAGFEAIAAYKKKRADLKRKILLAEKDLADKQKQLALFEKAEADRQKAEADRQKTGLKGYFSSQVKQDGEDGYIGRALKDARSAKGADLTDEESEAVRKIAKMTYSMNNRRENDPGDLSIKTNSLTARGGFQGGAAAPDLERYNRITAENSKQSLARMRMLETNVAKILKIFEG